MGGITLFFGPGCAEEFMSCPCGEWTWAEHHQHRVLGKLCPPGFGAAQRLLAFNYKQLNNVFQLTAGKRKGRNGSQGSDGRPQLLVHCLWDAPCAWGGGEGHLWDLLGAAAHLVPCCPCCQDGAWLWSRAGTQLPTTGARRAEGWGWGWAGGQEMLDLMPGDSLGSKKNPRVGWMEEVAQGGLCVCPPSAHPASQEQEKHRGCLEDANILSEGSGRASRGCG